MNYCEQCGSPLEHRVVAGRERPACTACGHIVFRNPVPVAVVMATEGDRLLLIRRANEPLRGYWAPPAGYIEIDETLEAGAAREVKEETGYDIKIEQLINLYSRANIGIIFAVYRGHIIGGQPQRDEVETLDMALLTPDEFPRQNAPVEGTELEGWFFEIITKLLARFSHLDKEG